VLERLLSYYASKTNEAEMAGNPKGMPVELPVTTATFRSLDISYLFSKWQVNMVLCLEKKSVMMCNDLKNLKCMYLKIGRIKRDRCDLNRLRKCAYEVHQAKAFYDNIIIQF
jgi:hypothetical protein